MATEHRTSPARKFFDCRPVDAASLAVFRILIGGLLAVAMVRFLARGWVGEFFVQPTFHFTYDWLPWIRPLPGWGMHALFVCLALLGAGIALGWRHRVCAALFCLGFTYAELIDRTNYLNHYYLVSLLTGLLAFLPADRIWSLDAWKGRSPRPAVVPAWTVNLLRFQVGVVYFFAGVAKLNPDWLMDAQPLRLWLNARADLPVIGPWLTETWVAYAASWLGAAFDLSIPFLLLARKSRPAAFCLVVIFHVATAALFPTLGMFPWLMLASATIFLPPDWPRIFSSAGRPAPTSSGDQSFALPRACSAFLLCYCVVQVLLPLRGVTSPLETAWSGEGFNFAWRVMVVEKAGHVEFAVRTPNRGALKPVSPDRWLTPLQVQMMAQDPGMIRDLARHIATMSDPPAQVFAESWATLNGRPRQRLVNPAVDLAGPELPEDWILPLKNGSRASF